MIMMAAGAVLGGVDRLLNNRFGLGKKFEDGFMLLGPMALSMAGIVCLTPLLSELLGKWIAPVYRYLRLDPAMFAGILAIDMGGYPMAMGLADDPAIGRFAGIIVGAIFGCTASFAIPVGMGMLGGEERGSFVQGTLYGLIAMPAALILGGILCGLGAWNTLWQLLPVLILSGILLWGIRMRPKGTVRAFRAFARGLDGLITVGLILGVVQYMTGWVILPGLMPLEEAMESVAAIGIVLLGSLPMAEILKRALRRPLEWMGKKIGVNAASMAGFLLGAVSFMPMLVLMKDMDRRGRVANAAAAVCLTSVLGAHLGYTVSQEPDMLLPMLLTKAVGGILGAGIALMAMRKKEPRQDGESVRA